MFFETDRLFIRELDTNDTAMFVKMQSNENVMKYITGQPKTKEESINELNKIIQSYKKTSSDFLVMAVVRKNKNEFIGTCAVIKNDEGEYEIGYRFIEDYWGKGYGKEVVKGLIKFTFQTLNLDQIVAHINKNNYKSIKILESLNFDFMRSYRDSENGDIVVCYKMSKPQCKQ